MDILDFQHKAVQSTQETILLFQVQRKRLPTFKCMRSPELLTTLYVYERSHTGKVLPSFSIKNINDDIMALLVFSLYPRWFPLKKIAHLCKWVPLSFTLTDYRLTTRNITSNGVVFITSIGVTWSSTSLLCCQFFLLCFTSCSFLHDRNLLVVAVNPTFREQFFTCSLRVFLTRRSLFSCYSFWRREHLLMQCLITSLFAICFLIRVDFLLVLLFAPFLLRHSLVVSELFVVEFLRTHSFHECMRQKTWIISQRAIMMMEMQAFLWSSCPFFCMMYVHSPFAFHWTLRWKRDEEIDDSEDAEFAWLKCVCQRLWLRHNCLMSRSLKSEIECQSTGYGIVSRLRFISRQHIIIDAMRVAG